MKTINISYSHCSGPWTKYANVSEEKVGKHVNGGQEYFVEQFVDAETFHKLQEERNILKANLNDLRVRFEHEVFLNKQIEHTLADKLADVVAMFIGYTTPEDCPTPHKMGKEALDEYNKRKL